MIFYSQSEGKFTRSHWAVPTEGEPESVCEGCYAGRAEGKNVAAFQDVHNVGPLPRGQYTLGPLHRIPHLGPAMPLTPDPANEMFGRSGFFVHLDNPTHIGASSDGCIVMPSHEDLLSLDVLREEGEDQVTVTA